MSVAASVWMELKKLITIFAIHLHALAHIKPSFWMAQRAAAAVTGQTGAFNNYRIIGIGCCI